MFMLILIILAILGISVYLLLSLTGLIIDDSSIDDKSNYKCRNDKCTCTSDDDKYFCPNFIRKSDNGKQL